MIPSSLASLVLFVVLLTPGFVCVLRKERTVPSRQHSGFRESLRVLAASVGCLGVTALTFAAARVLFPARTLNFGGLVRDPSDFARVHYVQLLWWSIGLLSFAALLGCLAADPRLPRLGRAIGNVGFFRWFAGETAGPIQHKSAWYRVVQMYADATPGPIIVGAQLDDGSYVQGRLQSFDSRPEEIADRELLLTSPLRLVMADGETVPLNAQYTVLSARRIVRLDVTHLDPETPLEETSEAPAVEAQANHAVRPDRGRRGRQP